jgi:MYXO-CTERM domain-containing protein
VTSRLTPSLVAGTAAALALALAPAARADGAFPDSFGPLLPRTRPHEIILATNFGLVFSEDDGATWQYACEVPENATGRLYGLGAPPEERIYAVADPGVIVSSDGGCTWTTGGGAMAGMVAIDQFPDPTDPLHVLGMGGLPGRNELDVFESRDAGLTYAGPLFTAPTGSTLTGMEIAASDDAVLYVTFYQTPGTHPRLARSSTGGGDWTIFDLEPDLGEVIPFLAAVDPADPNVVYLRLSGGSASSRYEGLGVTHDGGATFSAPVTIPEGALTSFLRRQDGTVLVAGIRAGTTIAFRSTDGAATFTPWPLTIHPRGIGERAGTLYAATDNFTDGFALATSTDGDQWTPLMRYQDIAGIRPCLQARCQYDCATRSAQQLFSPSICAPSVTGPESPAADSGTSTGSPEAAGCGCTFGRAPTASTLTAAALLAFFMARRRRR